MTDAKLFYLEINLLCISILLLLARKLRQINHSLEQTALIQLLVGEGTMFLFDTCWVLINGSKEYGPALNYTVNIAYFFCSLLCPYLTLRYLTVTLRGRQFTRRTTILLQIPVWTLTLISILSIKTGWIFTVNEENLYHRGSQYIWVYLFPLIYMIGAAVFSFICGLHSKDQRTRRKGFVLCINMLLPVIGSVLCMLMPQLVLVCCFVTVSMVYLIFEFQQGQVTKDSLTHLSNRYDLMLYLEGLFEEKSTFESSPFFVVYADIDYFKSINDTYGHLEGDHALCRVADALKNACRSNNGFPVRLGGDEFVIVFSAVSNADAMVFKQRLKKAVSDCGTGLPYELSLSAGMTRIQPEDREDIPAMLERADADLYIEKKNRPPQNPRRTPEEAKV